MENYRYPETGVGVLGEEDGEEIIDRKGEGVSINDMRKELYIETDPRNLIAILKGRTPLGSHYLKIGDWWTT